MFGGRDAMSDCENAEMQLQAQVDSRQAYTLTPAVQALAYNHVKVLSIRNAITSCCLQNAKYMEFCRQSQE